jgi:hypothetical protein
MSPDTETPQEHVTMFEATTPFLQSELDYRTARLRAGARRRRHGRAREVRRRGGQAAR